MPRFPWPRRVALRLRRIVRPGHLQITYRQITDDLHLEWNRGGTDFLKKSGLILGYIDYFSYPIFVGYKAEKKGSSMIRTSGLAAVDQAGVMLDGRFEIEASSNGGLTIHNCDFLEGATMSMSRTLLGMIKSFLLAALLSLAACGGGGGGGGGSGSGNSSAVVYGGNTNAAVVTTTNASKLTANVTGSDQTLGIIGGVSVEGSGAAQNQGSGLMDLAWRLSRTLRDTVVRAEQASSAQRPVTAVIPVDQTDPCDGGNGSVRTSGTLNDNSTGTLQVSFNSCLIDSVTLNGPATLRVDAVASPFPSPTDFTLSFERLTLRGPGLSIDAGGTLRAQLQSGPDTETITANLVALDNNTGETAKAENLVFVDVYVNTFIGTPITSNVSGKVFDQVHGYVDITTPILLVFGTQTQLFPDSGQMLLTGTNSTVLVTALNSTMVELQLDTNGDSTVDNTARMKWTELSGPVGSNLADDDGDLMHNSWETVNGLNPNDGTDAAANNDGDAFTNLQEYQNGTNPNIP